MTSVLQAPHAVPAAVPRPLPLLRSLVTGTPPHLIPQAEVQAAAVQLFPRLAQHRKLLDVFSNAGIDTRALARPLEWYLTPRPFTEKNAVFVQETLALSERLAREALERAGVLPAQVDAVVFVTSSGISAPGLESLLIGRLGLNPHAVRLPLWGLGCAGGAAGLARAADLVRAGYDHVLLLAAETCSLTLVRGDESSSNFVSTALFSDGAAAAVLGAGGAGPDGAEAGEGAGLARLHGAFSTQIEGSADVMGWDVVEDGLQVRFRQSIPELVREMMRENVDRALAAHGWAPDDLRGYVVHPGGIKVITAYEEALSLPAGTLDTARRVLRRYGNMSSPTVLFVLEEALRSGLRGRTLLSAMGPGFSAEHVLLELGD